MKLQLSQKAQYDLLEIEIYTYENWGEDQSLAYSHAIEESFRLLLANPKIGRNRSDLRSGYRSLTSGKHVIFYRAAEKCIFVLSILHIRQDHNFKLSQIQDD